MKQSWLSVCQSRLSINLSKALFTRLKSTTLFFYVLMYSLANRLLIDELKTVFKHYFYDRLMKRLNSSFFSLTISEMYHLTSQHDRRLRNLIIKIIMRHLMILRDSQKFDTKTLQNDFLQQIFDFACDFFVAIMNECVTDWKQLNYCRTEWRQ